MQRKYLFLNYMEDYIRQSLSIKVGISPVKCSQKIRTRLIFCVTINTKKLFLKNPIVEIIKICYDNGLYSFVKGMKLFSISSICFIFSQ